MLAGEFRAGLREGSVISIITVEDDADCLDDVWTQLRSELEDVGISSTTIDENRGFIVNWFEHALRSGYFEECSDEATRAETAPLAIRIAQEPSPAPVIDDTRPSYLVRLPAPALPDSKAPSTLPPQAKVLVGLKKNLEKEGCRANEFLWGVFEMSPRTDFTVLGACLYTGIQKSVPQVAPSGHQTIEVPPRCLSVQARCRHGSGSVWASALPVQARYRPGASPVQVQCRPVPSRCRPSAGPVQARWRPCSGLVQARFRPGAGPVQA